MTRWGDSFARSLLAPTLQGAVDVSRFAIKGLEIRTHRVSYGGDSTAMRITMFVNDRDHPGMPQRIESPIEVPHWLSFDQQVLALRDKMRELVLHELDECLLVHGVRKFDPHRGE